MNSTLRHRGPDDEGYYFSEGIGLAMRRLKIIDLETGNQPVFNEDKNVCVVYNGEIYNFLELRKELVKKGHKFSSKSDTEVIVHLYEEEGIDFITKLNGMFAFALWDNREKILYLVRDQFGIKPLYYLMQNEGIVFASELKAILTYPDFKREIDMDSLCRYLIAEYVPSPHTIFKGVNKLKPGHFLKFHRGLCEVKQYWRLELDRRNNYIDLSSAEERLRELLEDSVKIRMVSDVPLGAFLSGGIDSASVAYFMKNVHGSKVKTFSISFDDPSFDESRYSKMVSSYLDTEHYDKRMTDKDLIDAIPVVFDFLDEPLGDASIIPTYLLSKFARENVTVALSGDGGDELFAGYPTYYAHRLAESYSRFIPSFFHKVINRMVNFLPVSFDNFSIDFKLKRFFKFAGMPPLQRNIFWMGSFTESELKEVLEIPIERTNFYEEQESIFNNYSMLDDICERIQILDFFFYLQEDVLQKVDRASMACSLEVRIPFLDPRVVEFLWSLPLKFKLRDFKTKYLLKKSMRNLLPSAILKRKKKGFGIPVAKWFAGVMKDMVMDIFKESQVKNDGIFKPRYITKLLEEHFKKKNDHRKKLWTLFVFQHWLKSYGKI
jgi:asparagine synthase (glutamine-hydrolysing)